MEVVTRRLGSGMGVGAFKIGFDGWEWLEVVV